MILEYIVISVVFKGVLIMGVKRCKNIPSDLEAAVMNLKKYRLDQEKTLCRTYPGIPAVKMFMQGFWWFNIQIVFIFRE